MYHGVKDPANLLPTMMTGIRPTLEGPLGNGIYVSRDLEDAKMKLLGFKPKVRPPPPIVVVPPKEKGIG